MISYRKTRRMLLVEERFSNQPLEILIPKLLEANGGRIGKVADLFHVSRHSLYTWCVRLNIPVGKPRGAQ